MKKLPKIFLTIALVLGLLELVPGLSDAIYALHRPLCAVLLGLFGITLVLGNESSLYDQENDAPPSAGASRRP